MTTDAGRESRVLAGRYALTGMLGRGGMGVVWQATDQVLGRQVAVKEVTFPVDVTAEEREVLVQRTLREARAAARLDHPRVTRVYDVVHEGGKPWLVMEHVPSRSLQDIVEAEGPLSPARAARVGLDVLAAVEAAHDAGIVHRDVKPANVLVGTDGRASLTDFGIATTTGDSHLTTQGALIGSPTYMAPERARGDEPQPPVDLWGLGATLYAAVEGRPPFDRGEPMATLLAVVSEHPAPMLYAGPLEPIVRALLEKDPARRGTVASVRARLEGVASGEVDPRAADPRTIDPRTIDPRTIDPRTIDPRAVHPGAAEQQPMPAPAAEPAGSLPPPAPPRPPAGALEEGSIHRFDSEDLHTLASASKKFLSAVARETARELVDRRRERRGRPSSRMPEPLVGPPQRRRRFKRRWVVVPVLVTVVLVVLALVGGGLALAWWLGLL